MIIDDEVQMSGMAWGGLSEFYGSTELTRQYASARWGDTLAAEFGIGGIPPSHYQELLSGMRVRLSTRTDSYNRTFGGHCSPQVSVLYTHHAPLPAAASILTGRVPVFV